MPEENIPKNLQPLANFIQQLPGVKWVSADESPDDDGDTWWWVKFQFDISAPATWHVIQQLAHIINDLSQETRLPTVFYPVSTPVYLNGGPSTYLCWVIEVTDPPFDPTEIVRHARPYFPDTISDPQQFLRLAADADADNKH